MNYLPLLKKKLNKKKFTGEKIILLHIYQNRTFSVYLP